MFLDDWIKQANRTFRRLVPLESEHIGWEVGADGMRPILKSTPASAPPSGLVMKFADILSGSGLTYTVDIYSSFAADMTFTAITADETSVTAKVPDGALDSTFGLTAGQVYSVVKFPVDGTSTWIITGHVGIN